MELHDLLIQLELIVDSDNVKLNEFSEKIGKSTKLSDLDKVIVQNFLDIKLMYNKYKFNPDAIDLEEYLYSTMDNYRNAIHKFMDKKYHKG